MSFVPGFLRTAATTLSNISSSLESRLKSFIDQQSNWQAKQSFIPQTNLKHFVTPSASNYSQLTSISDLRFPNHKPSDSSEEATSRAHENELVEHYGRLVVDNLKFLYTEASNWIQHVFNNGLLNVEPICRCYLDLMSLPLPATVTNLDEIEPLNDEDTAVAENAEFRGLELALAAYSSDRRAAVDESSVGGERNNEDDNLEELIDIFVERSMKIIKHKRVNLREDDELKLLEVLVYYLIEYSIYYNRSNDRLISYENEDHTDYVIGM